MSEKQFDELLKKMDILIKITAANVFQGKKMKKGILFLSDLGLPSKEVANVLGTTDGYVRNVKSGAKKGAGKNDEKAEESANEQ